MPTIDDFYPSKWLKAADLGDRDVTVVIKGLREEEVGDDLKPVLFFEGTDKGLVLNKTNFETIAHLHGKNSDGWGGARIELFATPVTFQGKTTDAIRVRAAKKRPAKQHPAKALTEDGPPPNWGDDLDDQVPF